MNQRTYGLVIEELKPTDYLAGDGNLSGQVINPSGDWLPFIPFFEHQAPLFESNSCASQGTLNAVEMLNILIFGEEPNHSDRMLAKGSGTDPKKGNSPQKVAEFFRKNWSAYEEDWPMKGVQTSEEYYKDFPDLLYSKAEIVRGNNKFGYEAITNPTKLKLKEALTKGAVCISVRAWGQDENGLYYSPPTWTDNHYVTLLNIRPDGNYTILDSYSPYIKVVRGDHVPAIAYRYTLNEEAIDYITIAIKAIKDFLAKFTTSSPVIPAPSVPPNNYLSALFLAMRRHEGWYQGSRSQRNNNPLNCRYSSVGYHSKYGEVKQDENRFAIFKDLDTGTLYCKNLILEKAKKHPTWNLYQFIGDEREGWAPASDNNDVDRYAEVIASEMSVDPKTFTLSRLL